MGSACAVTKPYMIYVKKQHFYNTYLVSDLFFRPIRFYFMKIVNILVYGYITVYGYVLNY